MSYHLPERTDDDMWANRLDVMCDCGAFEHQFTVWFDQDEADTDYHWLYFYVHLSPIGGFFRRLLLGIRYAFGFRSRYGAWDEILVAPDEARKIASYVNDFLEHSKET